MWKRDLSRIGPALAVVMGLSVASCGSEEPGDGGAGAGTPTPVATTPDEPAGTGQPGTGLGEPTDQPAPPPASDEPASGSTHRVTYGWDAPSEQVTITHDVTAPPLPTLVAIYAGEHPEEEPPYQRMSFYFRGGFPSYNLQYVRSVDEEGSGEPIDLEGNAFLRVGFVDATAHDDSGSTIETAPQESLGFQNVKSYGSAGDFEGHVTYGLGLQVAPDSDQVLLVRAGELEKADEAGGTFSVVYVDVQSG